MHFTLGASFAQSGMPDVIRTPATVPVTKWEEIVALVPGVLTIEADAKRYRKQIGRRGNPWPIYSALKRRWSRLVGWDVPNPRLGTSATYDVVQSRIARALGVH
jgi:hypothetical protein